VTGDDGYDWGYSGVASDDWDGSAPSAGLPAPPPRLKPGPFGPFELLGELGRGGMGAVYRARDPKAEREVALKLIRDQDMSPQRRQRFEREGQVTANLTHPGIVRVHSAGEVGDLLYLAYELVPGARELRDAFGERDLRGRAAWVRDAAEALGFAHARGVVHRDVKPANLLVDDQGRVRVADFGLAGARGLERLTQTGAVVGTPTHMAPEQLTGAGEGDPIGPPADVWALGVVLYEALTGALPFAGENLIELAGAIARADFDLPRVVAPEVPADLEAVCVQALARDPSRRYPTGAELAADLTRALSGERVLASSTTSGLRPLLHTLRQRWRFLPQALAVGGALLLLAGTALVASRGMPDSVRSSLARGEVQQRIRSLDQASARLLRERAPLAGDGALARAEAELDLLLDDDRDRHPAEPGGVPSDPQLAQCAERIQTLAALRSLLAGDPAPVDALLARGLGDPTLSAALRGASAALGGDPEAAVVDLSASLRGLRRPELRALRGLARWRADPTAQASAGAALADLRPLAELGPLPGPLLRARVHLHLLRGEVPAALTALEAADPVPADLEAAVTFAQARLCLDESAPERALSLVRLGQVAAADAPKAAEQLWDRAEALARELLERPVPPGNSDTVKEFLAPTLATFHLLRLAAPGRPLPADLAADLVDVVVVKNTSANMVGPLLAEVLWDDYVHLAALTQVAVRSQDRDVALAHLPLAARASELAPTPGERTKVDCFRIQLADEANRLELVLELSPQVLPELTHDELRGLVLKARARARRGIQGDVEGAIEDLGEAAGLLPTESVDLSFERATLLRRLGRGAEALEDMLRYCLRESYESSKLDSGMASCWELALELGELEELRPALERYMRGRAGFGGWWVRLAWLRLRLGDQGGATAALGRAPRALMQPSPEQDGLRRGASDLARTQEPLVSEALERLRADGEAGAPALEAALESLERARAGASVP
jgi:serine/threonine protein kinase